MLISLFVVKRVIDGLAAAILVKTECGDLSGEVYSPSMNLLSLFSSLPIKTLDADLNGGQP